MNHVKLFNDYLLEGDSSYQVCESCGKKHKMAEFGSCPYANDEEGYEGDDYFDDDNEDDNEIYYDGNLYEAMAPKLTAKERQKAQDIAQLMTALNKKESYVTAKEKFVTIFKKEALKVVKELGLKPKVLNKLDKVTIKDI